MSTRRIPGSLERRWSALLTASPDLIFWVSRQGIYLDYHAARPELLAASPEEFIGRSQQDVLPPEVAVEATAAVQRAFDSGSVERFEYSLELPIGRRWFEARIVALDDEEVTVIVRDLTLQMEAREALIVQVEREREHRLREETLRRARDEAQVAAREERARRVESLGRLTAGVAHDFNNLLGVSLNYLHMLERSSLTTSQLDDLVKARDAIEVAIGVVGRLLASSSHSSTDETGCDAAAVLRERRALLESLARNGNEFRLVADGPVVIPICDNNLVQILINLVDNAHEATDHGTVTVTLIVGPDVGISVADTGRGMTPEDRERAVEPFFTTKPAGIGTGLGLAVVAGIVESSGGRLDISSAEQDGTTVRITWPSTRSVHDPSEHTSRTAE